ncbi:unnamed protein product [Echinostoma caproni]|uniref:Transposase n=1 Tax=Echinostoma caproni TaxID=27848 RepID=A0A183A0M1_9TREM|nr:unnamed protein product [Echinostoma caproni]
MQTRTSRPADTNSTSCVQEHRVIECGKKRAPASERIKNGTHQTRHADVAAGSTSRDNVGCHSKQTDNYSPTGDPQLARKIYTECHYVGAADQHISRYDRIKPAGAKRGKRGNVRAKCRSKPAGIGQKKKA